MELRPDLVKDALQVSPAVVTTGGFYLFGLPLSDFVAMASIVLICVQTGYRLWKWKMEKKRYEQENNSNNNSGSISDSCRDSS